MLIVTAHLGPFDSVGQLRALHGYRFTTLTKRTVPALIDAIVHAVRTSRGLRIEAESYGAVTRILQALRRGELVGLVADRGGSGSCCRLIRS